MRGLKSAAQRQASRQYVRAVFDHGRMIRSRKALGKRLQLPTDKTELREQTADLVSAWLAKHRRRMVQPSEA